MLSYTPKCLIYPSTVLDEKNLHLLFKLELTFNTVMDQNDHESKSKIRAAYKGGFPAYRFWRWPPPPVSSLPLKSYCAHVEMRRFMTDHFTKQNEKREETCLG